LVQEGQDNAEQAELAQRVPMADDITVEADSGGHTDNRPLVCLMPAMLALRDEAAGKVSTLSSRCGWGQRAASARRAQPWLPLPWARPLWSPARSTRPAPNRARATTPAALLAKASMADVMMAPSADMFEMGVKVQVLKTGTMFAMRAQKAV
jgi:trans-AT polyketide synthase, acyltransferase and oxidoreductase domains